MKTASDGALRYWWHRFGPVFAAEIRKRRIEGMKSSRLCWHLDEMFVKINGERHYHWRAVHHEGEVLENFVTTTARLACPFHVIAGKDNG